MKIKKTHNLKYRLSSDIKNDFYFEILHYWAFLGSPYGKSMYMRDVGEDYYFFNNLSIAYIK